MVLERYIEVTTPLGAGPDGDPMLQFERLIGSDQLSQCFRYELTLQCNDPEITSDKLLGEAITITLKRGRGAAVFSWLGRSVPLLRKRIWGKVPISIGFAPGLLVPVENHGQPDIPAHDRARYRLEGTR